MKYFIFDKLLPRDDICNLKKEKNLILDGIKKKRHLVVYGPRNYGKTSIIKNVIISDFKAGHKDAFVLFADFMDVKDIASISNRLQNAFENAFTSSFPVKNLLEQATKLLLNFRPKVEIDAATNLPNLSMSFEGGKKKFAIESIFEIISKKIATRHPALLVFDEFQDIAMVPEAVARFRACLQEFSDTPVILLGSKKHLLADLLVKANAPLAGFGYDIEFGPISYDEYHEYIMERFKQQDISISRQDSQYLQDVMKRVPEAVNIICASLMENFQSKIVDEATIRAELSRVIEQRRGRFEEYLSRFSAKEEQLLICIAKHQPVRNPTGRDFLRLVDISSRSVLVMIKKFRNQGAIDVDRNAGINIADPLLIHFLRLYR
ncbi:MAG: hypothetical protein A3K03_11795 [Bdellovibrionales bacterium RIFOXYD1_FULL_44_7]|nr:MAG: hypothetical protein A3K03_11795 [Bdellovibrionales bacterium RIFOXYD1_FULL_44_7]